MAGPLLTWIIVPVLAEELRLFPRQPDGTVITALQADNRGNIYIAGSLIPNHGDVSVSDAFVAKLRADGSQVYKTVLAGSAYEGVTAIAVAADGSIYAAGLTSSKNFPVTSNALQPELGTSNGQGQAFAAKLSPSGQVQSATYFGGGAQTRVGAIAITATGEVLITGTSVGEGFPATPGRTGGGNGFYLAKFDAGLGKVSFATLEYGGTVLALDPQGNIYTAGAATPTNGLNVPLQTSPGAFQGSLQAKPCIGYGDFFLPCSYQFVERLDPTATKLTYGIFVSGSFGATPAGIAVDASGNAILAGTTNSADYPVTPGTLQTVYVANAAAPPNQSAVRTSFGPPPSTGYVTKLNATGTGLIWSTFFGGTVQDAISGMSIGPGGYIYITGQANSNDLPGLATSVPNGCRPSVNQGLGFVARLSPDARSARQVKLIYGAPACSYSSCVGDTDTTSSGAWAVAAKSDGSAIAAGANGAIAAIDLYASSPLACMTDPTDNVQITTVAPGQIVSIFGSQIPSGVTVKFHGIAAPVLYASSEQVNVQVPYEIAGQKAIGVEVSGSGFLEGRTVDVMPRQPAVFLSEDATLSPVPGNFYCGDAFSRNQHALALNQDGTLNSCANGARLGSEVTIFLNGAGQTQPPQKTGAISGSPAIRITPAAEGVGILATTTLPGSNSGVAKVKIRASSAGVVEVSPTIAGVPAREPIVIWVSEH